MLSFVAVRVIAIPDVEVAFRADGRQIHVLGCHNTEACLVLADAAGPGETRRREEKLWKPSASTEPSRPPARGGSHEGR